ncbi:MAG: hypothetical protein ABSH14_01815 [Verrucomicrobiia bacterium]|jgi:hypothetical protein
MTKSFCAKTTIRLLDMRTRTLLLLGIALVVMLLLIAPFLARWGTTREVVRWSSANAVFGFKHPLHLSIQRDVAYVDIFSLYPRYRLFITGDGYYAYVRDFDVPSTDPKRYLNSCQVAWTAEGAELLTPDGERLFIPSQLILAMAGPD